MTPWKSLQVILPTDIFHENRTKRHLLELTSRIRHFRSKKSGSSLITQLLLGPSLGTIFSCFLSLVPSNGPSWETASWDSTQISSPFRSGEWHKMRQNCGQNDSKYSKHHNFSTGNELKQKRTLHAMILVWCEVSKLTHRWNCFYFSGYEPWHFHMIKHACARFYEAISFTKHCQISEVNESGWKKKPWISHKCLWVAKI